MPGKLLLLSVSGSVNTIQDLELMPSICLVSIDYLRLEKLKINPIFRNQLIQSDILVLSKCDLEPDFESQVVAFEKLKKEYPNKFQYAKSFNGGSSEELLSLLNDNRDRKNSFDTLIYSGNELLDNNYESRIFLFDKGKCIDIEMLLDVLKEDKSIVRAKGYMKSVKGWNRVNYTVGSSFVEGCESKPESKLVVIAEKNTENVLLNFEKKIMM